MRNEVLLDKEYINSIVSDMLDSLIVLDADGIIKTANRATLDLLGYKEEELIGRSVEDILPQDGGGAAFKDTGLKQLAKNGFIRGYEIVYRTKAGEEIPVILSGSIIYREASGSRAPMGIVCVAHDMREIKNKERKGARQERGFSGSLPPQGHILPSQESACGIGEPAQ